jgi:hypothetical protein
LLPKVKVEFRHLFRFKNASVFVLSIFLFLSILLSPYKPEMSMIRTCPDRLEFKNECYSTVNQSISKKPNRLEFKNEFYSTVNQSINKKHRYLH